METSWNVTDYPEPEEPELKWYRFDFNATISGYGVGQANSLEEAKHLVENGEYDDIMDTYNMEIQEITGIEEG